MGFFFLSTKLEKNDSCEHFQSNKMEGGGGRVCGMSGATGYSAGEALHKIVSKGNRTTHVLTTQLHTHTHTHTHTHSEETQRVASGLIH